jgi:23S rRNA pseudouridine1911/1915/1917 synthase
LEFRALNLEFRPDLKISQENSGTRLDKYLVRQFPTFSRAFLKSQIKNGNVLVNGKIKKPSYILKDGDSVDIKISTLEQAALRPNPKIKLKIIYEDENVIAIDKPAGITTHPARPDQTDTIVNALLSYYPPIKNVGDDQNLRPGIVHRLDKDTSGILLVTKNQKTFDWLKKQFAQRKVVKKYLALVSGKMKEKEGVISKLVSQTKGTMKRTTTPVSGIKEALTRYRAIKEFDGYTLIEAEPKTGRTHQIRVHFASIGHPLAGDKLYGFKNQICPAGLKRQFLHASYLKISLPDGKMVELKSKLLEDLRLTLDNLERKSAQSGINL